MAERVVVAMSGGVDSSVCAALLQEQGYDVIGMTMKLWDGPETTEAHHKTCCTLDDVSDARRVAAQLGIPFYVVNFKTQFAHYVIDYFVDAYRQGYTPNPCVQCNRYLKFTAFCTVPSNWERAGLPPGIMLPYSRALMAVITFSAARTLGRINRIFSLISRKNSCSRRCYRLAPIVKKTCVGWPHASR